MRDSLIFILLSFNFRCVVYRINLATFSDKHLQRAVNTLQ